MVKLSIILPIYNVEKYLPACLDSLYLQDLDESAYEIICVIDGSPDRSCEIVQEYAKHHSNLILVEQENKGVSAARNNGLRHACGKYIWFVDPDDMIVPNCIGKICRYMDDYRADVFELEYRACDENTPVICDEITFEVDGEDRCSTTGSGCLEICRKTYLTENGILFHEGLSYGEDYLWAMQIKYRKHKSIFTREKLYIYRQRHTSAMHTAEKEKQLRHRDDMLLLYALYAQELNRCRKEFPVARVLKELVMRQQLCAESALWYQLKLGQSKQEASDFLRDIKARGIYPYPHMTWNFGKGAVNPLKFRLFSFLFPFEPYYRLLLWLFRQKQPFTGGHKPC